MRVSTPAFDPCINGICLNIVQFKNTIATFLAILAVAVGVPEGYASQGVVTAHAQAFGSGQHPLLGGSEECGSCRDIGVPRRRPNSCRGCLASKPAPQRNCLRSGCPFIAQPIRNRRSRIGRADGVRSGPDITRTRPSARHLNRHS